MEFLIVGLVSILISLFTAWIVYPKILMISIHKNIVDSPNARKLQKMPVPMLGGFVVFSGILVALLCVSSFVEIGELFTIFCIMTTMLLVGLVDDVVSLSAIGRFFIEIFVIVVLLLGNNNLIIDDFHGLWGVYCIPHWLAIPLTVIAGVGIINAMNLIDGIDGLSSGYCIFASALFAIFFFLTEQPLNLFLSLAIIGGLIPFFMHNVFGKYSKMFIGDAGTLLMGSVMAYFVMKSMSVNPVEHNLMANLGIIPMLFAIMAVPIFDTLRVMTTRILKGTSPFNPDKTHLHHMFIRLGFSHVGATGTIVGLNMFVVLVWLGMYFGGCSIDLQFYVVIFLDLLITVILYTYVERNLAQISVNGDRLPPFVRCMKLLSRKLGVERGPFVKFMGRWMDRCVKENERKMLLGE